MPGIWNSIPDGVAPFLKMAARISECESGIHLLSDGRANFDDIAK